MKNEIHCKILKTKQFNFDLFGSVLDRTNPIVSRDVLIEILAHFSISKHVWIVEYRKIRKKNI